MCLYVIDIPIIDVEMELCNHGEGYIQATIITSAVITGLCMGSSLVYEPRTWIQSQAGKIQCGGYGSSRMSIKVSTPQLVKLSEFSHKAIHT